MSHADVALGNVVVLPLEIEALVLTGSGQLVDTEDLDLHRDSDQGLLRLFAAAPEVELLLGGLGRLSVSLWAGGS